MGRGQAWNPEASILALAVTGKSLNCSEPLGMMPSTHGLVGKLDKARNWGLALHKGGQVLTLSRWNCRCSLPFFLEIPEP